MVIRIEVAKESITQMLFFCCFSKIFAGIELKMVFSSQTDDPTRGNLPALIYLLPVPAL